MLEAKSNAGFTQMQAHAGARIAGIIASLHGICWEVLNEELFREQIMTVVVLLLCSKTYLKKERN